MNKCILLLTFLQISSRYVPRRNIFHRAPIQNVFDLSEFRNLAFPIKNFEQVITIGDRCLAKFRVNSFLKSEKLSETIISPSTLFDWMFIRNYTLFGEALLNEFNDTFGLEYLKGQPPYMDLVNEKYDFLFNHAFDGFRNIRQGFNDRIFRSNYHLISSKFSHLTENSKEFFFNSKTTLFIGNAIFTTHTQDDFLNFLRAIKSKRTGNFLVVILVSDISSKDQIFTYDKIIEDHLIFHKIKFFDNPQWEIRDSLNQWNQILNILLK